MATNNPSCASLEVVNGVFQFKINNSGTKDIEPGKCITTPQFAIGGCNWVIEYYPKGIKGIDANTDNIAVRIQNRTIVKNVSADYEIGLLNKVGRPMAESWVRSTGTFHSLKCSESCIISRSNLESNYVRDDNFIVVCTISLINEAYVIPRGCSTGVIPNRLGEELYALLERNEKTDVVFKVEGETICGHQLILASRSPVFRKELFGPIDQTVCEKTIDGIKPVVFKGLIQFMYTDSLPDVDLVSGEAPSTLFYHDLLLAADRYKVKGLQTLCEEHLCRTISIGTVVSSLALAEQYSYGQLKEKCLQFINDGNNFRAIVLSDEFIDFAVKCRSVLGDLHMKDDNK